MLLTFRQIVDEFGISPAMASRVTKATPSCKDAAGLIDRDLFEKALRRHKANPASIAQTPLRAPPLSRASAHATPSATAGGDHSRRRLPPVEPAAATVAFPVAADVALDPAEHMTMLRIRKAEADARKAEIATAEKASELVARDAVVALGAKISTDIRLRLEAIPTRIGPTLANLPAAKIVAALEAEIASTLAELAAFEKVAG